MKELDRRARFIKPSLDPQKLQHFLSVYECGAFSAAAVENNVSQQAVSKSIARLEDSLGVPLFDRSATGAKPTQFADALARRAKTIIAEGRLAAAELAALRGSGQGYVRIGLGWSFLPRIGPALIERFKRRHPGITISIATGSSTTLYRQLAGGDVELVASAPPTDLPLDPMIERRPLFIDRDLLIMRKGHPLAGGGMPSLEALAQQTWLASLQLSQQWERVCSTFLNAGLEPPESYIDLDSVMLLKALLLNSDGLALLSPELVSLPHETPYFHTIDGTPFPIPRTAFLATRRNARLQPVARAMIEDFDLNWRDLVDPALHL